MNIMHILADPGIIIVIITFIGIMAYYMKKIGRIKNELKTVLNALSQFKKSDIMFRFKELDTIMKSNPYISNYWSDFKNTLMFNESFSVKDENNEMVFQNVSQSVSSIQTTVDPMCFFNEETLITSRFNHKFIQTAPTILTGMGPLFTFLNIGIAFASVDFSSQEATISSVSSLMTSMQAAATVSVLAVSTSLAFLMFERILYSNWCKGPLHEIQAILNKLFDNISSEKFLIELLKETKIQNNSTTNLLSTLPKQFKDSFDKSLSSILIPYLENIIFGINKIQEKAMTQKKSNSDVVDDLF